MAKIIKITEAQLQEFIDMDGSIIDGNRKEDDSQIRTNYFRKNKRPQTSDDYAGETGQGTRWYNNYGFSVAEGKDNLKEDGVQEAIVNKNNTRSGFRNTSDVIPDPTELSKSYEQPELQNDLDSISRQLTSLGVDSQQENDIKAIILKQILSLVEVSKLTSEQQQEIKRMIR